MHQFIHINVVFIICIIIIATTIIVVNTNKFYKGDFVIWNDGSLRMLQAQAEELAASLEKMSLKIKPSVS